MYSYIYSYLKKIIVIMLFDGLQTKNDYLNSLLDYHSINVTTLKSISDIPIGFSRTAS